MRSRDVVGRRIVKVIRERWYNSQSGRVEVDETLVLDDGSLLFAVAVETTDSPAGLLRLGKKKRPGKNKT